VTKSLTVPALTWGAYPELAVLAIITCPPNKAVIVGAGYIGLEMTEALHSRGMAVVLVEKLDHVMGVADPEMVAPLHAELLRHGVDLRLDTSVVAFERQAVDLPDPGVVPRGLYTNFDVHVWGL
jgi:NADPH-dependent 2,4-dienoyl-CoA reductase/sulfur reductase-like enzyme